MRAISYKYGRSPCSIQCRESGNLPPHDTIMPETTAQVASRSRSNNRQHRAETAKHGALCDQQLQVTMAHGHSVQVMNVASSPESSSTSIPATPAVLTCTARFAALRAFFASRLSTRRLSGFAPAIALRVCSSSGAW